MSNLVSVTFIGGTADLTRKVCDLRSLGPIINVPVMPTPEPRRYGENPPLYPDRVMCRVDRYRLIRVSDTQAVALLDYLR